MAKQYWQQDPANKEKVLASAQKAAATRHKRYGGKRPGWPPKNRPLATPETPAYTKLSRKEKLRVQMLQRWEKTRKAGDMGRLETTQAAAPTNGAGPTLTKAARGFAKDAVAHFAIEGAKLRLATLDQERELLLMFIQRGPR